MAGFPTNYLKVTSVLSSPQKVSFYNVFYYNPFITPTFTSDGYADANTVGAAAISYIHANLFNVMTTDTICVGTNIELHRLGSVYDVSILNGSPGTVSGDELADFEAVCIQKRTANAGKSGRGRWFLGPVPETFTDENYLTDEALGLYNTLKDDWKHPLGTILGTGWVASLYSKKLNTLTELTTAYVDPKIASIGGRKSHSIL